MKKIIDKIIDNWGLKLVALLFSISIWFYVQGKGAIETALKYNVFFTNIPEGLYLEEANTSEISVWVKGPKHLLTKFLNNSNKLEISLKGQKSGRITVNLYSENFDLPSNFQIIRIQPEKITLKLTPFLERKVRVLAIYNGNKKISIYPSHVIVRGPKNIVENILYVQTEKIPDVKDRKDIYVKLINPSEKTILSQDMVRITFR